MSQQNYSAIPGRHPTTSLLIEKLKSGTPGDEKTDRQLLDICGLDTSVGGPAYGYLMSAIDYLRNHHNVIWSRMRRENKIRCLTPEEGLLAGQNDLSRSRRFAKRGSRKVAAVYDRLDAKDRPRAMAVMAQANTIMFLGRADTTKKLEASTPKNPGHGEVLKLFGVSDSNRA